MAYLVCIGSRRNKYKIFCSSILFCSVQKCVFLIQLLKPDIVPFHCTSKGWRRLIWLFYLCNIHIKEYKISLWTIQLEFKYYTVISPLCAVHFRFTSCIYLNMFSYITNTPVLKIYVKFKYLWIPTYNQNHTLYFLIPLQIWLQFPLHVMFLLVNFHVPLYIP